MNIMQTHTHTYISTVFLFIYVEDEDTINYDNKDYIEQNEKHYLSVLTFGIREK